MQAKPGELCKCRRGASWRMGLAGLAGLLVFCAVGQAGTISMQVSCSANASNLAVRLLNLGNEAAQNVSAYIQFDGKEYHSPPITSLAPNSPQATVIPLVPPENPGVYPAVVTVLFEDVNAHPFSSVTVLPVRMSQVLDFAKVAGALSGGKIRGKKSLTYRVRNGSDEAVTLTCRVVVPQEATVDNPVMTVEVPAHGKQTIKIPVENFSAMPASTYNMHVIAEYDQDGRHMTVISSTTVQMFPKAALRSMSFWLVLAVVVAGVCGSFFLPRKK